MIGRCERYLGSKNPSMNQGWCIPQIFMKMRWMTKWYSKRKFIHSNWDRATSLFQETVRWYLCRPRSHNLWSSFVMRIRNQPSYMKNQIQDTKMNPTRWKNQNQWKMIWFRWTFEQEMRPIYYTKTQDSKKIEQRTRKIVDSTERE